MHPELQALLKRVAQNNLPCAVHSDLLDVGRNPWVLTSGSGLTPGMLDSAEANIMRVAMQILAGIPVTHTDAEMGLHDMFHLGPFFICVMERVEDEERVILTFGELPRERGRLCLMTVLPLRFLHESSLGVGEAKKAHLRLISTRLATLMYES